MKATLFLIATIVCESGDYMIDFSSQAGAHVNYADLIVQVLPLDAYVIVYPPGRFGDGKKCCGGKPNLPMIMPMTDRKLCVRLSREGINWLLMLKGESAL
jgi:hypothetical protein